MRYSGKRALILGNYCSANRGDAAILSGLIELIREVNPTVDVTISSYFPELAAQIHQVPTIPPLFVTNSNTDMVNYAIRRKWAIRYGRRLLRPFASRRLHPGDRTVLDVLATADLVIGTGGTYINDNYRPAITGRLHELSLAKAFAKPVYLLGHSIGPFNHQNDQSLAREVLNDLDGIGVRDEASVEVLANLGVLDVPVKITGDTAFFAPVANNEEARQLALRVIPNAEHSRTVSVSVRRWWYYDSNESATAHEDSVNKMAKVCDHVAQDHDARIVFLSTCTSLGGYPVDDRIVAQEVLSRMQQARMAEIVDAELNAAQLCALYGLMDLHIGTRLHSVILASMVGTPSVAIAYEFKTSEFMRQLDMEDYVVDINDFSADQIIFRIDRAMDRRETLVQRVAAGLDLARQGGRRNLEFIRQALAR